MLARTTTRRLALSAARKEGTYPGPAPYTPKHLPTLGGSYPAWKLDESNWTAGKWVEMDEGVSEKTGHNWVWIPDNQEPTTLAEVHFDNSRKKFSFHMMGLRPAQYEMLFSLTAIGYILFTLYDWREEAKQ